MNDDILYPFATPVDIKLAFATYFYKSYSVDELDMLIKTAELLNQKKMTFFIINNFDLISNLDYIDAMQQALDRKIAGQ